MSLSLHMIDEYQKERVEFRKILQGVLSERHRWSQCVEWTNKKLGMAVGALFIRDNFNHDSKVLLFLVLFLLSKLLCYPGNSAGDDTHHSGSF